MFVGTFPRPPMGQTPGHLLVWVVGNGSIRSTLEMVELRPEAKPTAAGDRRVEETPESHVLCPQALWAAGSFPPTTGKAQGCVPIACPARASRSALRGSWCL